MTECPKGCGRVGRIRGMCNSHYQAARKYEYNRKRWTRRDSTGTARRLRALVAMGYSQADIGRAVGISPTYISKLANQNRGQVNPDTADRIIALYDKLSMTPGPSRWARDWAHRKGWMPPLAWDDDTIDDPAAQPNPGHQERVGFRERFYEMRDLGYSDLIIAQRWGMRPESLLRQLHRHDITPDAALTSESTSRKWRAHRDKAS